MNKRIVVSILAGLSLLFVGLTAKADGIEDVYTLHETAMENFNRIYEYEQQANAHDVTKPFTSNCRDFALSMLSTAKEGNVFYEANKEHAVYANMIYTNYGYVWGCDGKIYEMAGYAGNVLFNLPILEWDTGEE